MTLRQIIFIMGQRLELMEQALDRGFIHTAAEQLTRIVELAQLVDGAPITIPDDHGVHEHMHLYNPTGTN